MPVTREICNKCGDIIRVGYHVPDGLYMIVTKDINQQWCLNCFTKMADEMIIQWENNIQFFPVSFYTHINEG